MKTIKEISARLRIAKNKAHGTDQENKNANTRYLGSAFKISTEFVAAVAVSSTIGFILDNLFDTKPWLIILFFVIGAIAGMLNIIRTAKRMQKK